MDDAPVLAWGSLGDPGPGAGRGTPGASGIDLASGDERPSTDGAEGGNGCLGPDNTWPGR
jgi:hypothetical protein